MGRPQFNPAEYIGQVFGQWTVIGPGQKRYHVRARCTCGTERDIVGSQLRAGLRKRCQSCAIRKHGDSRNSSCLYRRWLSEHQRMPEPWATSYQTFREAVVVLGGDTNSSVRRIDPDLPYQPGNIYIYDAVVDRQQRLQRISEVLTILGNPRTAEQLGELTRERRYQLLMAAVRLPGEKRYVSRRPARVPTVEEKLAALAAEVPAAEWNRLPADLTDHLDHYLYGTPKTEKPSTKLVHERNET